jgi:hypothetical protein
MNDGLPTFQAYLAGYIAGRKKGQEEIDKLIKDSEDRRRNRNDHNY